MWNWGIISIKMFMHQPTGKHRPCLGFLRGRCHFHFSFCMLLVIVTFAFVFWSATFVFVFSCQFATFGRHIYTRAWYLVTIWPVHFKSTSILSLPVFFTVMSSREIENLKSLHIDYLFKSTTRVLWMVVQERSDIKWPQHMDLRIL